MKPILEYIQFKKLRELDVSDLRHLRKEKWAHPFKIHKFLTDRGYEMLGPPGSFGAAFAKDDSNVAVKVTTGYDPAWYEFYKYAVANKSNRYLPKFGKITVIQNKYFIVPMERLEKYTGPTLAFNTIAQGFNAILYRKSKVRPGPITVESFLNREFDDIIGNLVDPSFHDVFYKYFQDVNNKYPILMKTKVELFNIAMQKDFDYDLHPANIMQRKDGTIVILDPFYPGDD
jgi:hypothetical protein